MSCKAVHAAIDELLYRGLVGLPSATPMFVFQFRLEALNSSHIRKTGKLWSGPCRHGNSLPISNSCASAGE